MKNINDNLRKSIHEFKVFNIKKLMQLKKQQREFFEEIRKEKSLNDWLSIKDVMSEFKVSRKTIDRWRVNGLRVHQKRPKTTIFVNRKDLINYLKK
jgi:predicted transcriptional regulator